MSQDDAFPTHVFDVLNVAPAPFPEPIGPGVRVVEKRPADGPITLMTIGASRLPIDSGDRVELAVEVIDGQQGAGLIALGIVVDDMVKNRRVPPIGAPWRNGTPFLNGTQISAILVAPSRRGTVFDEVRAADGSPVGHVRMLHMLTDAEASHAASRGWDSLVAEAGSRDALLDVTRADAAAPAGPAGNTPVFLSKLHAEHPPRWVTFTGRDLQSVTGLESEAYMNDSANHEVWSVDSFVARFPFVAEFVRVARPGQTALFTDASGRYVIEPD